MGHSAFIMDRTALGTTVTRGNSSFPSALQNQNRDNPWVVLIRNRCLSGNLTRNFWGKPAENQKRSQKPGRRWPVETDAAVEKQKACFPTAAWKSLRLSHSSHRPGRRHLFHFCGHFICY